MKRVSLFSTTLVLAALLLAACGGQQTSTSVPGKNIPPATGKSISTPRATSTAATPNVPVTG
ncbi:MAG: hypothetical protein ACM3XO_13320, partial [Bacteroidota bacterium]